MSDFGDRIPRFRFSRLVEILQAARHPCNDAAQRAADERETRLYLARFYERHGNHLLGAYHQNRADAPRKE